MKKLPAQTSASYATCCGETGSVNCSRIGRVATSAGVSRQRSLDSNNMGARKFMQLSRQLNSCLLRNPIAGQRQYAAQTSRASMQYGANSATWQVEAAKYARDMAGKDLSVRCKEQSFRTVQLFSRRAPASQTLYNSSLEPRNSTWDAAQRSNMNSTASTGGLSALQAASPGTHNTAPAAEPDTSRSGRRLPAKAANRALQPHMPTPGAASSEQFHGSSSPNGSFSPATAMPRHSSGNGAASASASAHSTTAPPSAAASGSSTSTTAAEPLPATSSRSYDSSIQKADIIPLWDTSLEDGPSTSGHDDTPPKAIPIPISGRALPEPKKRGVGRPKAEAEPAAAPARTGAKGQPWGQEIGPGEMPRDVHVVTDRHEARRVVDLLCGQYRNRRFACDTEASEIDVTKESPCGHGKVICFSVYGGEDCHFGPQPLLPGQRPQDQLWVDTLLSGTEQAQEEVDAIWAEFRRFFEDDAICKVWHNYSFDRHILRQADIECAGFAGDTMHMARLWDSSRKGKGYSLENLTGDKELMAGFQETIERGKQSMKSLFGKRNIKKDGAEGKLITLPELEELQRSDESRGRWVAYSAYDAKATHQLAGALEAKLRALPCRMEAALQENLTGIDHASYTLWDLYCDYWRQFGKLLTDMEKDGMLVDREHLAEAEQKALLDQAEAKKRFRDWAAQYVPDACHMNVTSAAQVRQLLFAGVANEKGGELGNLELERVFKVPNVDGWVEPERAGKAPLKNRNIRLHGLWGPGRTSQLQPEVFTAAGWPATSTPVIRALAGKPGAAKKALKELIAAEGAEVSGDEGEVPLSALMEDEDTLGMPFDEEEWPADEAGIDQKSARLAGQGGEPMDARERQRLQEEADKKGYGLFYAAFGGGKAGLEACAAADALTEVALIDTLLSNFIVPLQGDRIATPDRRVHCSLNINTETGRLSARRPNLQNQPALEKDRYKVRKAFTATVSEGKTLLVSDYGQLELRLLAHMASCQSMLEAFKLGGDFHSRTALGMYDHIKEAIADGKCLLEWDGGPTGHEPPPVPLLKDMFGSERRKAKVLNFSIAYGKTAHGLSKDWKVSLSEAEDTVKRWYSDRPEVLAWQDAQREMASSLGYVCTLLGRRRQLPDAANTSRLGRAARNHALRAAINTPIQGSAADVATAAMLTIQDCQELRELGWKLLLQVHDEVILEGPRESADRAKELVTSCMENPFGGVRDILKVALLVDCKYADTWYEAK